METPKPMSAQEAYEAQATAVMLSMAAVIHALEETGVVRPGAVSAILKAHPPHHPNKAAERLARKMTEALATSLLMSGAGGGRA